MPYLFLFLLALIPCAAVADDGSRLWLRATPNAASATVIVDKSLCHDALAGTAAYELRQYWHGSVVRMVTGGVGILAYDNNKIVNKRRQECLRPQSQAFRITANQDTVTITASSSRGLLYGAYTLLRCQATGATMPQGVQKPTRSLRILNHWDNPDGTVERGYAGRSLFWPADNADMGRVRQYARACASVGINATVLNNVNAKPAMLSAATLKAVRRYADALRPYGIQVFLSVNFASPKALGHLTTADPLNPAVKKWWEKKAREIYRLIPDFGGFLVKANSEGEPGPGDYHRSHAEGANMLAHALTPYGGRVLWRAFVYSATGGDRASQAYTEFLPLDGEFDSNVIIQIKNGPIDFQPREATSPLFYALRRTAMMPEVQITQEYTGESIHTCFLASLWSEFEQSISGVRGVDAVAGVANVGDAKNFCGSDMAQANWYAFGRMAWDNTLSPTQIAHEWLAQTYSRDERFLAPMTRLLCASHEAVVNYMMPLGLHHIFAGGHHYGPEPWCDPQGWRDDWKPRYYHRADTVGLGFNRTDHDGGSANTALYPDSLRAIYNNVSTCPEPLLLWFHHVPWGYRLHSGETLWDALCHRYDQGVRCAAAFADVWCAMSPYVDKERHAAQQTLFDRQALDAWWWRDACLLYFQQFSRRPLPIDCPAPRHSLDTLTRFSLGIDNYTRAPLERLP